MITIYRNDRKIRKDRHAECPSDVSKTLKTCMRTSEAGMSETTACERLVAENRYTERFSRDSERGASSQAQARAITIILHVLAIVTTFSSKNTLPSLPFPAWVENARNPARKILSPPKRPKLHPGLRGHKAFKL